MTSVMEKLSRFYFPLAGEARKISLLTAYEDLFSTVVRAGRRTPAADFHAKNISNAMESVLLGSEWHSTAESPENGVGPGAAMFAGIISGKGKTAVGNVAGLLQAATRHVRRVWPWLSQIRVRHVQSLFCECQKLLMCARKGSLLGTTTRVKSRITVKSLRALLQRKQRQKIRCDV